ncbi:MAG: Sapep family Mn(2+)-dependent dipeptidase [Oscillospiraceae bacterium]|jgi:succinyl-diaminopimelate desuccinylase|nr:Sapep family Mn(2+)-dependent dipeptidase [Oscillospiraceae bacterium]
MCFGKNILKYKDDILKDLDNLIKIPSCAVYDPACAESPYGDNCKRALAWILFRASEMGFRVKNVENYAGHAEYGAGQDYCAVLSHIDVVPVGDGWKSNPFSLVQKDSKFFGRGVVDDKGPAIISLYCLRALKDHNIVGKRRIRTIFGSGEEVGMKDMGVYFNSEPLPDLAFTPDSSYGICNREKGGLGIELRSGFKSSKIKEISSGSVINAVPDSALAILSISKEESKKISDFLKKSQIQCEFKKEGEDFKLEVFGTAAHASEPHKGRNAASLLISLLVRFFDDLSTGGGLVAFLDKFVGSEIYGESMGIARSDRKSGKLTLNLGILKVKEGQAIAQIDIRYPVTCDGGEIWHIIEKNLESVNVEGFLLKDMIPLDVSEDSKIIRILKKSYKKIAGLDPNLLSTGGGTYARTLQGRGVSFGPVFESEETGIHQANERMNVDSFFLHAQVCLEAMKEMLEF